MSKYNARPCDIGDLRFDSQAEGRRYQELQLLQAAGEISGLIVHPRFMLQEAFRCKQLNRNIQRIEYEGDFMYCENGRQVVEDVKGMETEGWKIKRKLFLKRYPEIDLRIVRA